MKRNIILVIFLLSFAFTNAQNLVYDQNAEVRNLPPFTGIEISGNLSLYLAQGNQQGVAVSAGEAKYNDKIITQVKNGVLVISVDAGIWNGFSWTDKKLKAYVTVTSLDRVIASGATYTSFSGPINTDLLNVDISGASEIKGTLNANKLNLSLSGASESKLSGNVQSANLEASGACKLDGYDLNVKEGKISASGASSVKITVTGELYANASGGSVIYYKGGGVARALNASGGASIKNRQSNQK